MTRGAWRQCWIFTFRPLWFTFDETKCFQTSYFWGHGIVDAESCLCSGCSGLFRKRASTCQIHSDISVPWIVSWPGFWGWLLCMFSPIEYKGTKWFGTNQAPALLSRFPSLDHNKKSGSEETAFRGLNSLCIKSWIQVLQFGYTEKIGLAKTLDRAAICKKPLHS